MAEQSDAGDARFACPHCGRRFRWKSSRAGRSAVCACGGRFRIPREANAEATPLEDKPASTPSQDATSETNAQGAQAETASSNAGAPGSDAAARINDDDVYELNLPEEEAPPTEQGASAQAPLATPPVNGKCPSCNQAISPEAVICIKCGFNLREGRKIQTDVSAEAQAAEQAAAAESAAAESAPAASAPTSPPPLPEADNAQQPATSDNDFVPAHERRRTAGESAPTAIDALYGGQAGTASSVGAQAAAEEAERAQSKELYLPAIFIAMGLIARMIYEIIMGYSAVDALTGVFWHVLFDLVLWTPIACAGVIAAAMLLGTWFGSLTTMPYKMFGIVMCANMVAEALLVSCLMQGLLFAFVAASGVFLTYTCIYLVLLPLVFDMETSEIMIVGPIVVGFIMVGWFMGMYIASAFPFLTPYFFLDFF